MPAFVLSYVAVMFGDLIRALTAPEPERLPEPDARLALAALLVRLAKSDGDYAADEQTMIDKVLAQRHGLSPADAQSLRGDAEALEAEAPDTVRFTRAIKGGVDYDDRAGVVAALWKVVLADGIRDHEEDAMMRLVAPMLGINDRDSALIRQEVESTL